MHRDLRNPPVVPRRSPATDVALVALGAAFDWLLALACQNRGRGGRAAHGSAAMPSPRRGPPSPPSGSPTAERASSASEPLVKSWVNGAQWMSPLNLVMENAAADAGVGATLQDIRALQTQTQQAAQDAHAAAFVKFNQTQDVRFSKQADAIVDKDDAFNAALKRIPPGAAAFQCLGAEGRLALCSVMVGSVHERDNGHKFADQAAA